MKNFNIDIGRLETKDVWFRDAALKLVDLKFLQMQRQDRLQIYSHRQAEHSEQSTYYS